MSKPNYFKNNKVVPSGLIHEAIISAFPELYRVMEIQHDTEYLEFDCNCAYWDEQHRLCERYFRVIFAHNQLKPSVIELRTQTRKYA
jgi:hypothetical protein